ncbi:MAG: hypothetical protein AB1758_26580 [Candidatus Eremiobacterota bacterium]
MRNWLTLLLAGLLAGPALAGPTRSGVLRDFTPGQATFFLVGEDGKARKVMLVKNAHYEVCGRPSASSAFRDGMKVAVRICGALNDNPLQADLLMDLYSSSKYVQRTAQAPYYTAQGDFAFPGGVGGISQGTPGLSTAAPNVIGQLAQGGNFPGSTTNPAPGTIPPDPNAPNNNQNPNFPTNQATNATPNAAAPSPAGSPFVAEAVNTMTQPNTPGGATPGMSPPPATPYPGTYYPGGNPTAPGYGPSMPTTSMMGMSDPQTDAVAMQARMMNGNDDDPDGTNNSSVDGFNMGPQVVQWQARVVQIDPVRRMLVVQPLGSPTPQNVLVPPSVSIPPQALQAGQMIQIVGTANAAGFVEAQMIQPMAGP